VWRDGDNQGESRRASRDLEPNRGDIPMNPNMTVREAAQPETNATELSTGRFIVVGFDKNSEPMGWIEGEPVPVEP